MRRSRRWVEALGASALVLVAASCGASDQTSAGMAEGIWRAVLKSPGGELPFSFRLEQGQGGELKAFAINGTEKAPFTKITAQGDRVEMLMEGYDSSIEAQLSDGGKKLSGTWKKRSSTGFSQLDFEAAHGDDRRFMEDPSHRPPVGYLAPPDISGSWKATFVDEDGEMPARGEFKQDGDTVSGTFLTPTGDYRYLQGEYKNGLLRLSTFDGAHAFLFVARIGAGGDLKGDFWSRDSYHATWTASRLARGEVDELPNPYQEVSLTNSDSVFRFSFPDLNGNLVTSDDAQFQGRVVLVNIFGSWCPNCNDEAPLLAQWHRRFGPRGLKVVGLAFEITGDPERDRELVARFGERYGIHYPLLLAGTSDKDQAASVLPDINRIRSFPTSIFIDRKGEVRRIYSGFSGPATGDHHLRMVEEFEGLIRTLLQEDYPGETTPSGG